MNTMNEVIGCEVCDGSELTPALDLGMHPMCDDLVAVGDSRECKEYPIHIYYCRSCNTAHQRFQVPKNELFPSDYHYRSRFTADVLDGMQELVSTCMSGELSLENKTVLDIGCNDGSLLRFFKSKGARTIGIEPTDAALEARQFGHIIYQDFITADISNEVVSKYGHPDFITFTNVFAHIENLDDVLSALRLLIGPNTTLIIENHYLGSVLSRNQFDTFYHEHPRTYSVNSFLYIARKLNLSIFDLRFPARYGGNIRIYLKKAETSNIPASVLAEYIKSESGFFSNLQEMGAKIQHWRHAKSREVSNILQREGRLPAKGFPGRSAILIKLLGLNESTISAVYEKPGSLKIGHYVPGTKIPILSDAELLKDHGSGATILNLAWHISNEIREYLQDLGHRGNVVDIISQDDME